MPFATALALLLSTATAQTEAEVAASPQHETEEIPLPVLGLGVAGGAPEGLVVSAVVRPLDALRFFAGPAWNYFGWGVHGGVTLAPWRFAVTPTLTGEAGRYFAADLGWLAKTSAGVPAELEPLLHHVAYNYVAGHLGIELGDPRRFTFHVRAGLARIWLTAPGTTTTQSGGAVVQLSDPHVDATIPSVRVGMQLWF
jgi:hypothetical protein